MALSLLQDAQTRGLAAALAGIKREEVDHNGLTMSPPPSIQTSHHHHHHLQQTPVYPGFNSAAAASALGMLSPSQILAANRTAAAAFMAAQLPMSTLASTLFPHHPALFGSWAQSPTQLPPLNGPHSPPASPISPTILNAANSITTKKNSHMLNNNNNNNNTTNNNNNHLNNTNQNGNNGNNGNNHNNNNIVSTTMEIPAKKARKISVKKDLLSPPIDIPMKQDIYTPSGPISPPSSGSSPNSQQDLPVHNNSKDPSRDKSFTCKICNRSFGYKHVLQNHERTHTGEKPFECPECHKRFTRDHHLKTHMRLHTGEKPYHCSHCDRQFVQVANLRRHLRVHTGERPYTCEICEARFSDSNQLKSHVLIHNGEKPFECERCHMKFRRRHHLMHHKCGIQTPPTPAISPAMSDYDMSGQKSTISSYSASDESNVELNHKSASSLSANLSQHQLNNHHHNLSSTLSSPVTTGNFEMPLDLSEEGINNINNNNNNTGILDSSEKRSRKSSDIRRVLRLPTPKLPIQLPAIAVLPEQTEPEDLSMRSPKSWHSPVSPPLVGQQQHHLTHHHQISQPPHPDDLDLEDLDDAATLNMKQRQKMMQAAAAAAAAAVSMTPKRYSSRMDHD